MFSNRRRYIPSQQSDMPEDTPIQIQSADSGVSSLSNNLEAVEASITEIKQSLKELEEKYERLDSKQRKLESYIDSYLAKYDAADANLSEIRTELESFKKSRETTRVNLQQNAYSGMPVMPGLGFASVTPEYLKGLKQNR